MCENVISTCKQRERCKFALFIPAKNFNSGAGKQREEKMVITRKSPEKHVPLVSFSYSGEGN